MAETLLSFGVEKLWALLVRESDRLKGVDGQLTELKSDVNLLRSFMKDADAKKRANETVRNCVEEIKEIVLDAEDVIETFLLKERHGRKNGIRKRIRRLAFTISDRRELVSDMEGISERVSKVIRDMQSFGVQQMIADGRESQPHQEIQREMRHTFSSENESNFVGLGENVKKLVGYLVKEDSIQVVSITGMGGIGKTTLARQVFNHEMVHNHFDGVVWVCISQQFTRKYVWEAILEKLSSKHEEQRESDMTVDKLQDKLFRLLETSKSLIILDDMWNERDWDIIKPAFPPTKGWKILITSRNEDIALHVDPTGLIFRPESLTAEESWTLFLRIAFPSKDTTEFKVDKDMEYMGKEMIKHCGGLPLAVKVLGGLLAAQCTLHQWKRIYENIGSHMVGGRTTFNGDNNNWVYHVLSLSYEELPIYLKHCFLYLAHYPEDYEINVEKLSYYWAGEGIPKPEYYERASVRDIGDGYIEELIKRNMVISERNVKTSRFETCRLHDMMREVCLLKAKEENFVEIIKHISTYPRSPSSSRRLAVHLAPVTYHLKEDMKNPKLRSFVMFPESGRLELIDSGPCFTRLPFMRVLDLSSARFGGGKLPSSIGKLIHLKYLSLSRAHVTHLPYSMRNLKLLLYLNLGVYSVSPVYVPNVFKEMHELTYLSLPWRIRNKVKLELGNLVNLETLVNFSTKHGSLRDLQGMTRLRALSITIRGEGCTMDIMSSSLSESRHMEYLSINDHSTDSGQRIYWNCVHLKQLRLGIHMLRLPDRQVFLSHFTYISLDFCRLEEDPMMILEKLVHLKELDLLSESFCGKRMVCSAGGFPQLHKLGFSKLQMWEEWIVEEGSMPLLHTLSIERCEKLKELPAGLPFVTSLKSLTCYGMEVEWNERLLDGGEDYYKIQHIPSVMI